MYSFCWYKERKYFLMNRATKRITFLKNLFCSCICFQSKRTNKLYAISTIKD